MLRKWLALGVATVLSTHACGQEAKENEGKEAVPPIVTVEDKNIGLPIPVPAWVFMGHNGEKHNARNDYRTAIVPPIPPGSPPPPCENPPDDAQILRALKPFNRGVPILYEVFREDVQIVTERLVDRVDPPRFYPLIGWAQLHHCHYKCTVYYTETKQSAYPLPFVVRKPQVEVVYIDKDYLHLAPTGSPEAIKALKRDLSGGGS